MKPECLGLFLLLASGSECWWGLHRQKCALPIPCRNRFPFRAGAAWQPRRLGGETFLSTPEPAPDSFFPFPEVAGSTFFPSNQEPNDQ